MYGKVRWEWYMQLILVEESFKTLKSDLSLRPIHHQIEKRVEAHILDFGKLSRAVAFLGYCLTATPRVKLSTAAPGLTPRAVLQSLSAIQIVEVHVPTSDGRVLVMPRHTELPPTPAYRISAPPIPCYKKCAFATTPAIAREPANRRGRRTVREKAL